MSPTRLHVSAGLLAIFFAACAPAVVDAPPEPPLPWAPVRPALPPIPYHDGPLTLDVVHPPEGQAIGVRDSTFIFGRTGTGAATLTINDRPVAVAPNGAFLAFLPVPQDGVYRLAATAHGETVTLERRVVLPDPPVHPDPDEALILTGTISPRGAMTLLDGEIVEVRFRGTPGGVAALLLPDGTRIPLLERRLPEDVPWGVRAFETEPERLPAPEPAPVSLYHGVFTARPLRAPDPDLPLPTLAPGLVLPAEPARVELVVGADTARADLPLNLSVLDPDRPRAGMAYQPEPYPVTEGRARAAAGPGYTFHYFWPNGTELTITGERRGEYRVRLAPGQHAWLPAGEVRLLPAGTPPAASRVGTVRLTSRPTHVDVRLELERRIPFRVDPDGAAIEVTLFGATGDTGWLMHPLDPYLRSAVWSQPGDGVYRLRLELESPVWGYAAFWEVDDDLVIRLRRPPTIDPRQPLRGLVIALDPGHPPLGATGPTGLTEAAANLAIALPLQRLLERAGAEVVLTRSDDTAVGLYERTRIAEQAGAHIFVSLHNNAFPDGVNPFENAGTSVFYFHPHSADLAAAMQHALLAELRLRDLGVGRASLAVVRRLEWMPAVLTESVFMMVPEQEAALRDPATLERIARAHLRALERFLRERAR